jgi:hypothetical protein
MSKLSSIPLLLLVLTGLGTCLTAAEPAGTAAARKKPGFVHVATDNANFTLMRAEKPYYIKGAGGKTNLALLAASGANSVRTWGADAVPEILPDCRKNNLTICVGFWLSHAAGDYTNAAYKAQVQREIETTVTTYRKDPNILIWAIGNETNAGADTPDCWRFIGEMAHLCHQLDPDHPTMTVLAHPGAKTMDSMAELAPEIDILGVNSYGGLTSWPSLLDRTRFKGAYIVSEWGPTGQWEIARTAWGKPIEQTSAEKAKIYAERYQFIAAQKSRCLGSYVFLWGQKQETTPTWFSMFAETAPKIGLNGESCPTVDAMAECWSGRRPKNVAPVLESMMINGKPAKEARFKAKETFTVAVKAQDPDQDKLSFFYEVMSDRGQGGNNGGAAEDRPGHIDGVVTATGPTATVSGVAPGDYRLFIYVLDGKGHLATANIPFKIDG